MADRETTLDTDTAIFVNTIREHASQDIHAMHPLLGVGNKKDIIGAAILLASDHARWITGSCFPIDGGYLAR